MEKFIVPGFSGNGIACGIKRGGRRDIGLIFSHLPATAAGTFTTNYIKAAPLIITRDRIRRSQSRAVIVNSGNANACTGTQGKRDAKDVALMTARSLKVRPETVLVASTGVIGERLPVERIKKGIPVLVKGLKADGLERTARAIMTTDKSPKVCLVKRVIQGREIILFGMAKGAGMIHPRMATMLTFVLTDASIKKDCLSTLFKQCVDKTLNRISVDGETSTNDMALILANGISGISEISYDRNRDIIKFKSALMEVLETLAKRIVRDGEGGTKVLKVFIKGAPSDELAERICRRVSNSPLVKTALFGGDMNWGRVMAAIGSSDVEIRPSSVSLWVDEYLIVRRGVVISQEALAQAEKRWKKSEVGIAVKVGDGSGVFSMMTTDLSCDYVKINAGYRT